MNRKAQSTGAHVTTTDATTIGAGATVATSEWWWDWDLFLAIPDGLKFIGIVATVVYLIYRAANEIKKFYAGGKEDD